ncbi:hypothetical protein [Streptomyces sp. NPDC002054]|uniref:hypothetical protein n=1 Tax=Streptomyces sp. NPDC002054 TaxID=3154663 RepID=UPI00332DD203
MASRFELRSRNDVPCFLMLSMCSWRQAKTTLGAYGASLIPQPLRRAFYTLSAWQDRGALSTYADTGPSDARHRAAHAPESLRVAGTAAPERRSQAGRHQGAALQPGNHRRRCTTSARITGPRTRQLVEAGGPAGPDGFFASARRAYRAGLFFTAA